MLKNRLISSAILVSIVGLLLVLDFKYTIPRSTGGLWLLPLLLLFAAGTAYEVGLLLGSAGFTLGPVRSAWIAAAVTLAACVPWLWPLFGSAYPADCPVGELGWPLLAAVGALSVLFLDEIRVFGRGAPGALGRMLGGGFVVVYVALPFSLLVAIRALHAPWWGLSALVATIAITKSCDAGAYFTGRSLGRHKMIPRVSPGKTMEGTAGGVATSILVAYACAYALFPALAGGATFVGPPWWGPLLFGIVCAVAGIFGDLAESMLKRELGTKDSGSLLPGLGGIWDVSDSLIGVAGPAFLGLTAGLMGSSPP